MPLSAHRDSIVDIIDPVAAGDAADGFIAEVVDARALPLSRWRRLLRPLLVDRPLLDGLSWRQIGMVTLVAIPIHPAVAITIGSTGNWGGALYWLLGAVLNGLFVLVLGVVLSNLGHRRLPRLRPPALALAVVLGCALGSALFALPWALGLVEHAGTPTGSYLGDVVWFTRKAAVPWGFVAAAWYFMERSSERSAALRDTELSRRQVEVRIVEARLRVLQAQTEPHFLFNTLAHVKRLYRTDPALGRRMLDRFCDYLLGALPQIRSHGTTLGRELELACAYLDVQHVRMGARLDVDVDVPDDLRSLPFPPMMLLQLVENAIKHGLNPLPEGGAIAISAKRSRRTLQVTVADTGKGFSTTKGGGVGLSNIRARLESLYGTAGRLSVAKQSQRGIVATIEVPLAAAHIGTDDSVARRAGIDALPAA